MLEHVGRENYATLGDVIHRCLPSERARADSLDRPQPPASD